MEIAGAGVILRAITVLGTSAGLRVDGELPDWAATDGKIDASFDPAIFDDSARVRIEIVATADDGGYSVRVELFCEFGLIEGAFCENWPSPDGYVVIDAIWPHARGALQSAAFTIDRRLPLRVMPPGPHTH